MKHILLGNNHIADKGFILLCQSIKKCDNLETVDVSLQIQQDDEYNEYESGNEKDYTRNSDMDTKFKKDDDRDHSKHNVINAYTHSSRPNGHLIEIYMKFKNITIKITMYKKIIV